MTKRFTAESVLTRHDVVYDAAAGATATLDKLQQRMRTYEVMSGQKIPIEVVEFVSDAFAVTESIKGAVAGAKLIFEENTALHRALQEKLLVSYQDGGE